MGAPFCLHLLSTTFAIPIVHELLRTNRIEDASQLASLFEGELVSALGPWKDVRMFGHVRAGFIHTVGTRVVTCDACGRHLRAEDYAKVSARAEDETGLPKAVWCSRCNFAPYCGPSCEEADKACH